MADQRNKHSKLTQPAYGNFGRNEWSVTGTNCDQIKALANMLISAFSKEINCVYIDTHHRKGEENLEAPGKLSAGAFMEYSNQLSHTDIRLNTTSDINLQSWFTQADFILVNGNHHAAANQVIVIDEKKKSSLMKRMPGLGNIRLVLLADGVTEPFDFVKEALTVIEAAPISPVESGVKAPPGKGAVGEPDSAESPLARGAVAEPGSVDWSPGSSAIAEPDSLKSPPGRGRGGFLSPERTPPVLSIHDHQSIIEFFHQELQNTKPPLYGLVLAGGKSQRMGIDKPSIAWHGKQQRYHLADELKKHCADVYISCREDQQAEIDPGYKSIPDSFTGLGPYGAILSAFRAFPDTAWLVLASDLPLLTGETIEYLIANRVIKSVATAYAQPLSGKPEPLIAIWEPKSYPILLSFLSRGFSCPKKVLQNSMVSLVQAREPGELMNVNTPEEKDQATRLIQKQLPETKGDSIAFHSNARDL